MRAAPFVLLALCAAILFSGHDRVGFIDEREARDAATGYELVARREVLTPVLAGEAQLEKPVLAYGIEALGAAITWNSPYGPRLIKGALAAALVLLTASVAARHFGPRAGWFSAGVLATTLGLPLAVRTDGTQVLGTLLAWAGVQGFADARFGGRQGGLEPRLIAGWGGLAAALVVAGPLPALWPLAGLALYARLAHDRDAWRQVRPIAGLLIMLGIALPWYGAMIERHGADFLTRVAFFPYADQPHRSWYAGPVRALAALVVGGFPWTTLLPGAAMHAATWWHVVRRSVLGPAAPGLPSVAPIERERREEGAAHFFIACLAAALLPVALYPVPPLPAALPALPAVAILCGRLLDHLFEDQARAGAPLVYATRMLAVVGTAGAILLSLVATRLPAGAAPEVRALAAIVLVASCAPFLAAFMGRARMAALLLAAPVALGAPWFAERVMPAMEEYLNTRDAAEAFEGAAPPSAPLVVIGTAPPSLRLYTTHHLVERAALGRALQEFRASDGLSYVAFRPAREDSLRHGAHGPIEILLRTASLVVARVHPG